MGYDPGRALYHFFIAPLTSLYGWSELMVKGAPLILIGVGLAIGFRAHVWNIGPEGQLTMGAVAGGVVALAFSGAATPPTLPPLCVQHIPAAVAYAAVPALPQTP